MSDIGYHHPLRRADFKTKAVRKSAFDVSGVFIKLM